MKLAIPLLFALVLGAQDGVVTIETWRVKAGDDPQWAQSEFDDSGWEATPWPRRFTTGSNVFFAGIRWYRATVSLAPGMTEQALGIGIAPLDEVFDVFVNGSRIGTFGEWEPSPKGYFARALSFPIPSAAIRGPEVHVAIRRWTGRTRTNFASLASAGLSLLVLPPEIGPEALVRTRQELFMKSTVAAYVINPVTSLGLFAAGILSLALFFAQRASRENLWLGLALMCEGLPPLAGLAVWASGVPLRSPLAAAVVGLQLFSNVFWMGFLWTICEKLRKPLWAAGLIQGLIALGLVFSYGAEWYIPYEVFRAESVIAMTAAVATAVTLLADRRGAHSTILAGALFLQPAAQFWFTQLSILLKMDASRYLHLGAMVIDPRNIARLVFACTALTILYVRHRREQERQAQLDHELAAARLVQETLLGGRQVETPGFAIDIAYLPANEVGGDFYQRLESGDGSVMVLVGDVSGKGLRAALLVGHISGALSNERSRRPSEVLTNLNESLQGRTGGGFVTCACARFDPDGSITMASAGHPAPYLGGQLVEMNAGLPLGVVHGTEYAQSTMALGNEAQFVLVSDGVIEAANAKNELFGFERTREISEKSAHEIADAAKAWGQNDDITVVTVRRIA